MVKRILAFAVALALTATMALPAFAEDAAPAVATPTISAAILSCMQTAVEKRDNAVIASVDVYAASVKAALVIRRDALKAAWGMSDKVARKGAIKAAWDVFKGTWKSAKKIMKNSRKASWASFKTDRKACHADGEGNDEGSDSNL